MPSAWIDSVRSARRLSVKNNIGSGSWSSLFSRGVREINRVLQSASLNIEFVPTTGDAAADVEVAVSDGPITYTYRNVSRSIEFNSQRMHGYTGLLKGETSGLVEKAMIFLPSNPHINTPSVQRRTGVQVMTLIMLHEFVHSLGLSNNDHSTDDIFHGNPDGESGSRPDRDRVIFMGSNGYVRFPPYFLSSSTVGKIQSVW